MCKAAAAFIVAGLLVAGCGRSPAPAVEKPAAAKKEMAGTKPVAGPADKTVRPANPPPRAAEPQPPPVAPVASPPPADPRIVAPAPTPVDAPPHLQVDEWKATAAGIRKLSGKRIDIYTDLPANAEVDRLPEVFEQAFPQWCAYFHVDPQAAADWRMRGFLMKDKSRFQRAGLLPDSLPEFAHGFSWNYDLWLNEQPSDYYRRHLLLHEGTHSFMSTRLGSCGPRWFMEGVAELLATHRWQQGRLTMNYMPQSREEVPEWGRVRLIKDAFAAGRALSLRQIIDMPSAASSATEAYAWFWGVALLLDRHPRYQERFRSLIPHVRERDFTQRFYKLFESDWQELWEEWQLLVSGMEYGYDISRVAVDFTPGRPLPEGGATVTIAADRGWQSSGVVLEAGAKYRLRASGRYQVANQPQIWWCEPNGVSIRYYQGRPLGLLLAAVRPNQPQYESLSALLRPTEVGLGAVLSPSQSGTLYLKINDSAAELGDNAGELKVEIRRE